MLRHVDGPANAVVAASSGIQAANIWLRLRIHIPSRLCPRETDRNRWPDSECAPGQFKSGSLARGDTLSQQSCATGVHPDILRDSGYQCGSERRIGYRCVSHCGAAVQLRVPARAAGDHQLVDHPQVRNLTISSLKKDTHLIRKTLTRSTNFRSRLTRIISHTRILVWSARFSRTFR